MNNASCVFCKIAAGHTKAAIVFEDDDVIVFLDHGPLFPGHCLVSPKQHYDTLPDVPVDLLCRLFEIVQQTCRAVETSIEAEGTFVAVNNKVSQSVPHLHVHVVPRRRGDGLKGFFWPRRPYRDAEHLENTRSRIASALTLLRHSA